MEDALNREKKEAEIMMKLKKDEYQKKLEALSNKYQTESDNNKLLQAQFQINEEHKRNVN